MIEIREYVDERGKSPFAKWFARLDPVAAARITVALARLEAGNTSPLKGVGAGVLEYRVGFGPGYRLYLGRDGDAVVILLVGGTKRRQASDIARARRLWSDYKRRKRE